jgi:hypothetical protein
MDSFDASTGNKRDRGEVDSIVTDVLKEDQARKKAKIDERTGQPKPKRVTIDEGSNVEHELKEDVEEVGALKTVRLSSTAIRRNGSIAPTRANPQTTPKWCHYGSAMRVGLLIDLIASDHLRCQMAQAALTTSAPRSLQGFCS